MASEPGRKPRLRKPFELNAPARVAKRYSVMTQRMVRFAGNFFQTAKEIMALGERVDEAERNGTFREREATLANEIIQLRKRIKQTDEVSRKLNLTHIRMGRHLDVLPPETRGAYHKISQSAANFGEASRELQIELDKIARQMKASTN